jgi:hypothetical protein
LRDRQRVEQLHVRAAAAAALEIRLGAVRDLSAALPPGAGVLDEFIEPRGDSGAPLPARPADQQRGQIGVTGDVAGLEHRQAGGDVVAGHAQRLGHVRTLWSSRMLASHNGYHSSLGDLADDVGGHVVVQQHQIEVGVRQQLAAAEAAGGDDGEATGRRDADLGRPWS